MQFGFLKKIWRTKSFLSAALALGLFPFTVNVFANDWTQWGGPHRNFKANATGLATVWPSKGPKQLWARPLGEGHSAIIADGTRLYTMYSKGEQEFVIAMEAATGKTVWEHAYDSPTASLNLEYGKGPHSTPLVVGETLFTVSAIGKLLCLNKATGKVIWSRELWKEMKGEFQDRGYSPSPLAYKDTIILTLGGDDQALVAFRQKDGTVVWKKHTLEVSPSSHLIINVDGQDQLVAFMGKEIVGLDPNTGDLLWKHGHPTDYGLNISTPVWGEDNLLFFSSAYSGGSRVLKLTRKEGKTTATEVWFHRQMRVHHGTIVRVGDTVYGSSGDFGPAPFTAIDVKTGKIIWRDRTLPKSTFVYADGKFIILDEDGHLSLATVTPEGMRIHSRAQVLQNIAWTAPTLAGTTLYIRDRKTVRALDLR